MRRFPGFTMDEMDEADARYEAELDRRYEYEMEMAEREADEVDPDDDADAYEDHGVCGCPQCCAQVQDDADAYF